MRKLTYHGRIENGLPHGNKRETRDIKREKRPQAGDTDRLRKMHTLYSIRKKNREKGRHR